MEAGGLFYVLKKKPLHVGEGALLLFLGVVDDCLFYGVKEVVDDLGHYCVSVGFD